MMKVLTLALSTLLLISLPSVSEACGESLYRVGKGGAYRSYAVPLPGSLLMYSKQKSVRDIADHLRKSGHDVDIVDSLDALKTAMMNGQYDMVIGPANEGDVTSPSVGFLPIAESGKEKRAARKSYGRALQQDDSLRAYLKAIHLTLKKQQS